MHRRFLRASAISLYALSLVSVAAAARSDDGLLLPGQIKSPEQMTVYCNQELKSALVDIEELETYADKPTIESYYTALDDLSRQLGNVSDISQFVSAIHPDLDLRSAADACFEDIAALASRLESSQAIFARLALVDTANADEATIYSVEKRLRQGRLMGAELDPQTQRELSELDGEITRHKQRFRNTLRSADSQRRVIVRSQDKLTGVPTDLLSTIVEESDGPIALSPGAVFTQVLPILEYADDRALRRELTVAAINVGYPENVSILRDFLGARHKYAQQLGFDSYAAYVISDKMASSPQRVQSFLSDIYRVTNPVAKREYATLLDELRAIDPEAHRVHPSDAIYLTSRIKSRQFGVDTEEVRQYFEYARVRNGIFDLVESAFQVSIVPWETPVWHESVEAFSILDGEKVIGRFYLDMHPRENKGAAGVHMTIARGVTGSQLPISALLCDFPEPGSPMQPIHVTTFLHEFGHLLHGVFAGHGKWYNNTGVTNERDFIEAPSTLFEAWFWDYETLSSFAIDDSGDPLPRELFDNMVGARSFGRGILKGVFMYMAALSLELHSIDPQEIDFPELNGRLSEQFTVFGELDETHYYASFGHLMSYSAMYYTYLWSDAIAFDMLNQFESVGLRNPKVFQRYRDSVLAPGSSRPAEKLVSDFLGRPVDFDSFVESLSR